MDPPQFFGSYLKEKMCRFFKCKKGSITPENAESKCEFQGSFPWKSDQSLKDSGKREILKGCTISFLQTVKECDEDLNESVILENLRWIEDCPSNPDCQAIDHIECMDRSCNIPPDSCFESSSETDGSGSGSNVHPTPTSSIPHHSNPSPSSAPSQDSSYGGFWWNHHWSWLFLSESPFLKIHPDWSQELSWQQVVSFGGEKISWLPDCCHLT